METVDHDELGRLLAAAEVDLLPAEFQGQITGLWCRAANLPADLGLSDVNVAALDDLRLYSHQVWRQLEDPTCGYDLLLPDETASLAQRVDALAEWCDGLLYGIGHAGQLDENEVGEEVSEALRDLADIAHIELSPGGGEDDEQAYTEIVEYLRVVAQTLYVELHPRSKGTDHEH